MSLKVHCKLCKVTHNKVCSLLFCRLWMVPKDSLIQTLPTQCHIDKEITSCLVSGEDDYRRHCRHVQNQFLQVHGERVTGFTCMQSTKSTDPVCISECFLFYFYPIKAAYTTLLGFQAYFKYLQQKYAIIVSCLVKPIQ